MRGKSSRCQCGPSCSHALSGTSGSPRIALQPSNELGEHRAAPVRANRCAARPARVRSGAISTSYGDAARARAAGDERRRARATVDAPRREPALGGRRSRRRVAGSQASCECECGRKRPPSRPSFSNAEADVPPDVARAPLPRLRNEVDRRRRRARRRSARARGPWIDDLLPLERRIEVRNDSYVQPVGPLPSRRGLGRRAILVARAEGAAAASSSSVAERGDAPGPLAPERARSRPSGPSSGHDGGRRGHFCGWRRRTSACRPATGKTIVVDCDEPSSSSVCR